MPRDDRHSGDDREEIRGTDFDGAGENPERGHEQPREDPFGRGFERPEPGRTLEHWHEPRYSGPYDRWTPRDYVFYSGRGYHREFVEPYKVPGEGRYSGRGPKNYVRSDARVEEDVHRALTEDPYVDATDIRLRVDDGEATLEGSVPNRAMKRRAQDAVEAVRGVRDVHNRLRIGPPGRMIAIDRDVLEPKGTPRPAGDRPDERGEAPSTAEFEAIGGGSPPHYDRRDEEDGERAARDRDEDARGAENGPAERFGQAEGPPPGGDVRVAGDATHSGTEGLPQGRGAGRPARPRPAQPTRGRSPKPRGRR